MVKLEFNDCDSFALSWVDKGTTGTWSFVSVTSNVVTFISLNYTYLSDNDRIRLILQLIKGNSRVPQKLLKYFYGVTISIFF